MPPTEPDLMGLILEVVVVTELEGGVIEESLPEVETLASWVPPEAMTQVWTEFIRLLNHFNWISFLSFFDNILCVCVGF